MTIYKITNLVNSKIYIGATITPIKDRFARHIYDCDRGSQLGLHKAMRKYGYINFKIEEVDNSATTLEQLKDLETHYIKLFNTLDRNIGYNDKTDNYLGSYAKLKSPLSDTDVVHIRQLYARKTFGPKYWYRKYYKDRMSYSGFEKVWEGISWPHIMPEVFTEEALNHYKLAKEGTKGEFNHNALFKSEFVMEARTYYIDHSAKDTWLKLGKHLCCYPSFENMLKGMTYKNVPLYKKRPKDKCGWYLNGVKIEKIEEYKPVSTILESEE